jgi:hypothetical protein
MGITMSAKPSLRDASRAASKLGPYARPLPTVFADVFTRISDVLLDAAFPRWSNGVHLRDRAVRSNEVEHAWGD